MPLNRLKSMYEKRRTTLMNMLSHDRALDKLRKGQISGAIAEIDMLLKTIDDLRDQEIEESEKLDPRMGGKNLKEKRLSLIEKLDGRMRVKFENSQTKQNLINIFQRKCETCTKYEFFSRLAKSEGYEQIAHIFSEFSDHEKEHARQIFKYLNLIADTAENVRDASEIENYYHQNLYSEFETIANQENFKEISEFFKDLSRIEQEHEKRFLKLLRHFHERKVFSSEHVVKWRCRNCGHMTESKEAPKKCPVCKESQGYFEMHNE